MNGKTLLLQEINSTANHLLKSISDVRVEFRKIALFLGVLFVATVSWAQLPSEFNGNLRLWLDGSDVDGDTLVEGSGEANVTGGGILTQWNDKSGNGHHLDAPCGGTTCDPDYVLAEPAFNNMPVVDFNTGDVFRNNMITEWTSDHTVFIVFQQQATAVSGTAVFSSGEATGGDIHERFEINVEAAGTTNFTYHTTVAPSTVNEAIFGTQAAAVSAPVLYSLTRSGNNVTCYNNGVQSSTLMPTTGGTFQEYVLNINRAETLTNDCQIAEVLVYDTVLPPDALAKINNYLACKYGLVVATTTPGGIDPCNLALWMKGDAGTDTTGSNLNSWIDQGKGTFDGVSASGEEPMFNDDKNNFNPSLTFDPGNNDRLDLGAVTAGDSLMVGANDFSIYSVANVDTTVTGVLFSDDLCTSPAAGYYLWYDTGTKKWTFDGTNADLTNTVTVAAGHSSTDYSLVSFNRSGQTYIINNNEGLADTVTLGAPINYASTGPFTERWIGAAEGPCSLDQFDGDVSELIVVNGSISATQDRQIRSYLALKYGLTLPSTSTSYLASDGITAVWNSTPYWNDVAGIGRDDASGLDQRISISQDRTAIVTIATNNDFISPNSDPARTPFGTDNSYLVWGNNDSTATNGWTTTSAPTGFVVLQQQWRVKEVGTVGGVSVQVDAMNVENLMPTFADSLFLIHGPSLAAATPIAMSETAPSSGIWTVDGIDFGANDFFTFAVKNSLIVEFSDANMGSANEAAGLATPFPTVIATGTINIPTTVEVIDDPITATVVTDYDYIHDVLNFSQSIYTDSLFTLSGMTIVHDVIPESPNELVRFEFLSLPSNGVAEGDADGVNGPTPTCLYTITDDDSYNVEIEVPAGGNSLEGSTDIMFRVFGVGGPNATSGDITGTLTLTGTATSGADYTPLSGPIHFTIPVGDDDDTVTVTVLDDSFLEVTETVIGEISSISAGVSISGSSATANIDDDELVGVQVEVGTPVDANEGAAVSYTFALAGGVTNQTGNPVTGAINYGGTAIAADYGTAPTMFSIPNLGMAQSISVFAVNDQAVEITETLVAGITDIEVDGTTYSSPSNASANIFDQNSAGMTVSITSAVNGFPEGGGNLIFDVTLDGTLVNETGSAITGTVDLSSSGATAGADFTNVTGFTILNDSTSGEIIVPIIDDGLIEGPETVVAIISNILPFGNPNPTSDSVSVLIADNDSGGLQISIGAPVNATETPPTGAATVTFDVSIVSGATAASNITGTIDYSAGTAMSGSDFDASSATTYTILAGNLSTTVTLPVINDGLSEPDETVIATFTGNPSLAGATYVNTSSTAMIFDDDAANLVVEIDTLANGTSSGTEGVSDIYFVVGLELFEVNGTGMPITGSLALSGTAGSGDYSFTPPLEYSIPDGETYDTVMISVTDDFDVEFTETLTATILTSSVGTVSTIKNTATTSILDDELPALSISAVSTGDGEEGVSDITFTVSIDGGWTNSLGQSITGSIIYSGTATSGNDFTELVNFSIPDGVAFEEHTLLVNNDLIIENLESVIATLTSPNFGVMSIDSVVTADIIDNDLSEAQLTIASTVDGVEAPAPNGTDAEFVVSIVNGLGSNLENQTGSAITGTISIDGTATGGGTDYTYVGGTTFSIADNSLSDVLIFNVNDDALEEVTETIILTLTSTTLSTISVDSVATAELFDDDTDTDNDGLPDLYDPITGNIDSDCDGIFDGCDADPYGDSTLIYSDIDGDGIKDECDVDSNNDGTIDNGPDINNDGLNDLFWDPTDSDGDLLPDHVDPNDSNIDTDGDGWSDGADYDISGNGTLFNGCDDDVDGIHNEADADYVGGLNPINVDNDGDGIEATWDISDVKFEGQQINYIVSPNGDGVNETLTIQGIQVVDRHELIIFNRYGEPVYISVNYDNNWAGEVNQKSSIGTDMLGDGVYYYTLDVESDRGVIRGYIEIRK